MMIHFLFGDSFTSRKMHLISTDTFRSWCGFQEVQGSQFGSSCFSRMYSCKRIRRLDLHVSAEISPQWSFVCPFYFSEVPCKISKHIRWKIRDGTNAMFWTELGVMIS